MGIISVEQADRLYWLGRYTERVYTTLRMFCQSFDVMIDELGDSYREFCKKLDIPDSYGDKAAFLKQYPFDCENPDSIISNLDALCTPEQMQSYAPQYESLDAMKAHYVKGGLGDGTVKKLLTSVLEEILTPIRERRAMYEKDIPGVYEILRKGSEEARATAAKTLDRVREAMKINYFNDPALIKEQAARYGK